MFRVVLPESMLEEDGTATRGESRRTNRRRHGRSRGRTTRGTDLTARTALQSALSATLLVALASAPAQAQDISELEGLLSEQVVSTASKTSERASSAPALSTSISADDLRRYGMRTLGEAIDFLSSGRRHLRQPERRGNRGARHPDHGQ